MANVASDRTCNVAAALPLVSPMIIVPVPEPPKALVLVCPSTVPALMVKPPVKVLAPESVNCDVALFWITSVTFVPMTALMVVVPAPELELVIVPMLLMEVVESKVKPIVGLLIVILPVPVTPPVNIRSPEEPPVVEVNVRLLFNVTAPLKVGLQLLVALILNVPLLPEATVIGLANVPSNRPCNVAAALPLVSPRVITLELAPKALALV